MYGDGDFLVPVGRVFGTRFYVSRTAPTDHAVESYKYVPDPDCSSGDTATERQTCCTNTSTTAVVAPVEGFDVSVLGVTTPFSVVPR